MKHFMIKYQFANGTTEEWHREIGRFIAALDNDPELKGKIIYRCLKNRDDSSYYHLAAAVDEQAIKTLQARDFFKHYTEKTRQVAGGDVVVTPIELDRGDGVSERFIRRGEPELRPVGRSARNEATC
jgi:hypothetical protein